MKPLIIILFLSLTATVSQAQHRYDIYDSVDKMEYFQFTHQDTVDASRYNEKCEDCSIYKTREWRAWYRFKAYKNFLDNKRVDSMNNIVVLFYDSLKHIEYLTFTHQDTVDADYFSEHSLQCGSCYGHGKEWRAWYRMRAYDDLIRKKEKDSLRAVKLRQEQQQERDFNAQRLKEFTKKYGPKAAKRMIKNEVWLGMNDEMVLDEFGEPDDIKKVSSANGFKLVWLYYSENEYGLRIVVEHNLTFKNHILVTIVE